MSFTTDEDVLGEKAQNQYVLCLWGEWRENDLISYQQQPSRKCCKGQPSSFGQSFFLGGFFFLFYSKAASSTSQWDFAILRLIYLICLCCGGNSHCALIWKQSILHSLVLIKQPAGCFITPSQGAAENLQFKVFSLLMNSVSTARPLARNLPGESDKNITTQIYYYLPALMCQMFVLGTNLMCKGTLQSFYTSGSVHSSQRVLLSLLSLWKQLYNIF